MDNNSIRYIKKLPKITRIFKEINDKFNEIAPFLGKSEFVNPLSEGLVELIKIQQKQIKLLLDEEIGD